MPKWSALFLSVLALVPLSARSGHPMLTEDTGTQGTGNAELELGQSWAQDDGASDFVFQPQLSYGLTPTVDLIAQPSWISSGTDGGPDVRGLGDTNFDAKWRFYGAAPLSLGVRAGVSFATSQHGLGQASNTPSPHALLVATFDSAPFTIDANLGYTRAAPADDARCNLFHASIAANFAATEHITLLADADVDSNPLQDAQAWPAVLLAGAIYSMPIGLDLDIGYRARLNKAAVPREWLLGLTYRWAP